MKIGIFGGTFNPPHKGHRFLVDTAVRRLRFDRVILIPSSIPPHKEVDDNDPAHRLAMTRLAFPDYEVSDMEITREGKSYTVDTLRLLHRDNPGARLYFLCGSDMFLTMEMWKEPESIFAMATIVTLARKRREYLRLVCKSIYFAFKYRAKSRVLLVRPLDMSSSDIRHGGIAKDGVTEEVRRYISDHNLYGGYTDGRDC